MFDREKVIAMRYLKLMIMIGLLRPFMLAEEEDVDGPSTGNALGNPMQEHVTLVCEIKWKLAELAHAISTLNVAGDFEEYLKIKVPEDRWPRRLLGRRNREVLIRATRLRRIIKREWYLGNNGKLYRRNPSWEWDGLYGPEAREVDLDSIEAPRLQHLLSILDRRLATDERLARSVPSQR